MGIHREKLTSANPPGKTPGRFHTRRRIMEKLFVVPRKGANSPYVCRVVYKGVDAPTPDRAAFRAALAAEYAALERRECYARITEAATAAPVVTEEFLRAWTEKYL
jgi:hypothetical protein